MSRVTHVNQRVICRHWTRCTHTLGTVNGWVVSHMWMSHTTHRNKSCHTCKLFDCMDKVQVCLCTMINGNEVRTRRKNESRTLCVQMGTTLRASLFIRHMCNMSCVSYVSHVRKCTQYWTRCTHTLGIVNEWVMSYIWMHRVTRMNESCHTCKLLCHMCNMSCVSYVSHVRIWTSHELYVRKCAHDYLCWP